MNSPLPFGFARPGGTSHNAVGKGPSKSPTQRTLWGMGNELTFLLILDLGLLLNLNFISFHVHLLKLMPT